MKQAILVVLATLFLCGFATKDCVNAKELYLRRTTVVALTEDVVTVEDAQGNLWEFLGVEDWHTGDHCELLMSDNGTEKIQDDIIVRTFYRENSK